ncbi:hypothetical protein ACFLTZ_05395 [Chloroflexota bacterium]
MKTKKGNRVTRVFELLLGRYGERKALSVVIVAIIICIVIMVIAFLYPKTPSDISLNLSLIGVSVAIFGLLISAYFSYKHSKEYSSYIREFRGYMTNLDELLIKAAEIIEEAESSIKIAVDFFGIGSITAKRGHSEYIASLYKMANKDEKKVKVKIIVLTPEEARMRTEKEFPSWAKDKPEKITEILDVDKKLGKEMGSMGIKIKYHRDISFHLFLIDDKKALFYMEEPVKESERKTIGYVTEDPRMLAVLQEMFKRIDCFRSN